MEFVRNEFDIGVIQSPTSFSSTFIDICFSLAYLIYFLLTTFATSL